jgi:hypothetical protein
MWRIMPYSMWHDNPLPKANVLCVVRNLTKGFTGYSS